MSILLLLPGDPGERSVRSTAASRRSPPLPRRSRLRLLLARRSPSLSRRDRRMRPPRAAADQGCSRHPPASPQPDRSDRSSEWSPSACGVATLFGVVILIAGIPPGKRRTAAGRAPMRTVATCGVPPPSPLRWPKNQETSRVDHAMLPVDRVDGDPQDREDEGVDPQAGQEPRPARQKFFLQPFPSRSRGTEGRSRWTGGAGDGDVGPAQGAWSRVEGEGEGIPLARRHPLDAETGRDRPGFRAECGSDLRFYCRRECREDRPRLGDGGGIPLTSGPLLERPSLPAAALLAQSHRATPPGSSRRRLRRKALLLSDRETRRAPGRGLALRAFLSIRPGRLTTMRREPMARRSPESDAHRFLRFPRSALRRQRPAEPGWGRGAAGRPEQHPDP